MENINKPEEMFRKWQIKIWSAFLQDESLSRHSVSFFSSRFCWSHGLFEPEIRYRESIRLSWGHNLSILSVYRPIRTHCYRCGTEHTHSHIILCVCLYLFHANVNGNFIFSFVEKKESINQAFVCENN